MDRRSWRRAWKWLTTIVALATAAAAGLITIPSSVAHAAPTYEILGYPFRNNDLDDEFRADVAFTVPRGELPTLVRYDGTGDGVMDFTAARNTGQFPGIGQEYQIVRVDHIDAANDRVTLRVQGDAIYTTPCVPATVNLGLEVTFPSGVVTVPLPTEVHPVIACTGIGRPVLRIPWDNTWPGMTPNSQAGWGAITYTGQVTPVKFVIDPTNYNTNADCGVTTNGWYQFVKQDGSPTQATPTPVQFTVADHGSNPSAAHFITSTVDLSADGDGYYKLLAWADATASPSLPCTGRGWDPAVQADAWQVGSVFVVLPTIQKSFDASSFVIGRSTRLTFTISNPAFVAQSGLAFTDTLPAGLAVASPPNTTNTCGGALTAGAGGSTISLSGGTLATGPSDCTIAVDITNAPSFTTAATCPASELTNDATNMSGLSGNLSLADGFGACVSTTVQADLATSKAALNTAPVVPGTTFDYHVTVSNDGPSPAVNVSATDELPAALIFVSSADGCTNAGQTVSCPTAAPVPAGGEVSWTFTVRLDPGYSGDGSDLGNVAVASSDTPDPAPSNNANPTPVPPSGGVAAPQGDLSTEKVALNTSPVRPGETFDYRVTVTNNGPSIATGVRATDTLPVPLSFVGGTGCSAADQLVTCGPPSTVASGASVSWTFTVRLDPGYTGDGSDLGNVAVAGSDTADPSPSNNANTPPALPSGAVASPAAGLTTEKVALNTAPVVPGGTFDYRVTVTNNGPSNAVNVKVTDTPPAPLFFVSGMGCSAAGQEITCGPQAAVAPGSSVSWTYTVRLDPGYTGDGSDLGNLAVGSSDNPLPPPSSNVNPSPVLPSGGVAAPAADLATDKVALNTTPVVPGGTFDYQVTVTNNGPSVAANVQATDDLAIPLSFVSGTGCSAVGQVVTCGPQATLAVGASVSWTFAVRLDAGYTGDGSDLGNVAVAGSDTADPSPSNNANPSPVPPSGGVALPAADITTAKEALNVTPVRPGEMFAYRVTVTNNGPSVAVNARATDDLPIALMFMIGAGCSAAGQVVTCGPEPTLAVGASVSWTFAVRLDPGYTGDGSDLGNVAVGGSDTGDPSPSNNANPSPVGPSGGPGQPQASLETVKSVSSEPIGPGDTFTYTITTTNDGPSTAVNVVAEDRLPTPISFVSSGDACSPSGQLVTCGPQATLAPGASVSWTFNVLLDIGYTGDGSDLGNIATSDSDTPQGGAGVPQPSPVFPPFDRSSDVGVTIEITSEVSSTGTVTVVITNFGPRTATAVTSVVELAGGLVRSGPGTGADCTGTTTITCVLPNPVLMVGARFVARPHTDDRTEQLRPGQSVTITFPVQITAECRTDASTAPVSVTVDHTGPDTLRENDFHSDVATIKSGGTCPHLPDIPVTGDRLWSHAAAGLLLLILGVVVFLLGFRPVRRNPV